MTAKRLILTPPERRELKRRVRSRSMRTEDVRRARVILEVAGKRGVRGTATYLACSSSYVQRWAGRFQLERLAGLVARHQGRVAAKGAAKLEARILEWTRRGPDDGSTQWSTRRLARKLGVTHMAVARVWNRYGLQPHRLRHRVDFHALRMTCKTRLQRAGVSPREVMELARHCACGWRLRASAGVPCGIAFTPIFDCY